MRRNTTEEVIARLESNKELREKFLDLIVRHLIMEEEVISIKPPKIYTSFKLICCGEDFYEDFGFLKALLYDYDKEDYIEMEKEYYENHPEELEEDQ